MQKYMTRQTFSYNLNFLMKLLYILLGNIFNSVTIVEAVRLQDFLETVTLFMFFIFFFKNVINNERFDLEGFIFFF